MKHALPLLFLFLLTATPAAVPGFVHWTAAALKGYEATLKPKINTGKSASADLGAWGNHRSMIAYRAGDGEAEIHENEVDFFVVESGAATLVTGGTITKPRVTGPGEIRGPSIQGGDKVTLKPGDVARIPANTPHQLLVPKSFLYYVIKVQPNR
jgi:mannose-6-phosphate isomerase-like protein (cupin superfamily)